MPINLEGVSTDRDVKRLGDTHEIKSACVRVLGDILA